MAKFTTYTLVTTDDKNDPYTLEFGSLAAFTDHVRAHDLEPGPRHILLVNGQRTDWRVRTQITVEVGDAPKPRAKRRSKAEMEAARAAGEARPRKANGAGDLIDEVQA